MQSDLTLIELANPHRLSGAQLFEAICHEPWAQLLDSADSQHPDSRWDILVARPRATLQAFGDSCRIDTGEHTASHTGDPLASLQALLRRLFPEASPAPAELPFSGGAIGLAGYDLGRLYAPLPDLAAADIPLPDLAFGLYGEALLVDRRSGRCCWVARGQWSPHRALDAGFWQRQLQEALPARTGHFELTSPWQSNMDRRGYGQRFARVQAYLQSGDCYQVNLAQRFSAHFSGDPWAAYRKLRQANRAPFSAYLNLPQGQVLSVSPERFLQVQQGQVQTRPIKGTRPRCADPVLDRLQQQQLAQSGKDRAENLMIVDLLRNDLGKVCRPGSVQVPELFAVESFPSVHHLVSTVTGELETGYDAIDLLRGAFPGGSITGAPKVRAMQIIEELEPHRRNLYCGSIVALSADGRMDSSITIRTLACSEGRIQCWAGGGLVADSDEQAEYDETHHKVGKILPLLEGP